MATRIHIPYRTPSPLGASRRRVEAFAAKTFAEAKIPFDPTQTSRALIEAYGGKIEPCFDGALDLDVHAPQDFTVHYSFVDPSFVNLGMAVQLGHYLLHYPAILKSHPGTGMQVVRHWASEDLAPDAQCAHEARWFGHAVVMPEHTFRTLWNKGGMAACRQFFFLVHGMQVEQRAGMLGLLDPVAA
jgi:hypothetical protein